MNWKTNNKYVDVDTGEEITIEKAKSAYVILKKIIKHNTNAAKTQGIREITNECKRCYEGELFERT